MLTTWGGDDGGGDRGNKEQSLKGTARDIEKPPYHLIKKRSSTRINKDSVRLSKVTR